MPRAAYGCLALFLTLVAALHVLDRRDPRVHFVSEYALTYPLLLGVGLAAAACGGIAAAVLLWREVGTSWARAAAALLVPYAVGMVALALFPTDPLAGATKTAAGRAHNAAADVASVALLFALGLAWWSVSTRAMTAFIAAVVAANALPRLVASEWPGLHQRISWGTLFAGLIVLVGAARRLGVERRDALGE